MTCALLAPQKKIGDTARVDEVSSAGGSSPNVVGGQPPTGGIFSSAAKARPQWAAAAGAFGPPVAYDTGLLTRRRLPTPFSSGKQRNAVVGGRDDQ